MTTIQTLIRSVGGLVSMSIKILLGAALLVFFWGLVKFLFKAGSDKSVEEGKNLMKWGVIALFVMVSVWGLVGFIQTALEVPNTRL